MRWHDPEGPAQLGFEPSTTQSSEQPTELTRPVEQVRDHKWYQLQGTVATYLQQMKIILTTHFDEIHMPWLTAEHFSKAFTQADLCNNKTRKFFLFIKNYINHKNVRFFYTLRLESNIKKQMQTIVISQIVTVM